MIIQPKATRETDTPVDPRKRFDFNIPEKLSRVPLYFVMLVTGIALYLKSALPSQAATPPAEPEPAGDRDASGVSRQAWIELARTETEIDPSTTESAEVEKLAHTVLSSGAAWDHNFRLPDAPSLAFASGVDAYSPQLAPFFPVAFGLAPQNDNATIVAPARQGGSAVKPLDRSAKPPAKTEDTDDEDGDDTDADEDDDDDNPAPANRAPVVSGPVRLHDVFAGQVVLIGLSQLLSGALDADADILTVNDLTVSGGTLAQTGSGWTLTTLPGMLGTLTFTYNISDGLIEIIQTAMLEVVRKVHELTAEDDVYVGTIYDDDIDGLFGDDLIDARAGNDVVMGGDGADHIIGGSGDDQLFGGAGDDSMFGGAGNDVIGGGDGNDQLFGDEGDDVIEGDAGDDLLMGGVGNDVLDGGAGADGVHGEAGDDIADGGDGDDIVTGGLGDDVLGGGEGNDELEGNEGADLISAGGGDDTAKGGDGNDHLSGDSGKDRLSGDEGNDIVDGGEGNDTLFGNAGADTMLGGDGDDDIDAGSGDDLIAAGSGNDNVAGGDGDDRIMGDSGDDRIDGGAGHDVLDYSGFTAEIYIDLTNGKASSAEIGEDLVEQMEEVIGGAGDDIFIVGGTATILSGGAGDDVFVFAVSGDDPGLSQQIVHEILDFVVGDRIRVADYDIAQRERSEEERFEDLYEELSPGLDGGLPIRVHHERYDDMDHTIIEADLDRNDVYEISITVHGVLLPLAVEPIVA